MSSVHIYPPRGDRKPIGPLPELLKTPSGLALVELQGTINLPASSSGNANQESLELGRLEFPDYVPDAEGSAWMKRVHLFIGQHQRLTGEVKKLPKAIAIIQRREGQEVETSGGDKPTSEDLEIVEIVKYKIIFQHRPEPVGTANAT